MFLPLWLYYDLGHILSSSIWVSEQGDQLTANVLVLLIVDGVLHWLQNILAFTLLKLVAPLTYAVANVTKRVAIISVSVLLLQNQVPMLVRVLEARPSNEFTLNLTSSVTHLKPIYVTERLN